MAYEYWWASVEETGHWVLVVSKEEFQIGFDAWGFPLGTLEQEVLSLIPSPPETTTAFEIATKLVRGRDLPTRAFVKTIQKCLRQLREKEAAQSCPVGTHPQLGWHLPYAI
jgi:hypothetical protein